MKLKVKRLDGRAIIPTYATDGAAAFDITAIGRVATMNGIALYSTGLAFEVPAGHVMLVFSRSGHGFKHSIRLSNCVGVIDSDYRGELMVRLISDDSNFDNLPFSGDRVAQAMLIKLPTVELVECDELSDTKRGINGLGSTGK